jgi:hypothetical protein
VPQGVEVQVLSSAPRQTTETPQQYLGVFLFFGYKQIRNIEFKFPQAATKQLI